MEIPQEFHLLGRNFFQGYYHGFESRDEAVDWVLENTVTSPEIKNILVAFLTELIAPAHSNAELDRVWRSVNDSLGINRGGVRSFFRFLRDKIAQMP